MAEFDIQVNAGSTEVDAFLRSLNVDPANLTGEASSETWPERQQNRESTQDGSAVPSGRTDGVGSESLLLQAIERISSELSAMKAQMTSRVDGRETGPRNVQSPLEQGTELQARNATTVLKEFKDVQPFSCELKCGSTKNAALTSSIA